MPAPLYVLGGVFGTILLAYVIFYALLALFPIGTDMAGVLTTVMSLVGGVGTTIALACWIEDI